MDFLEYSDISSEIKGAMVPGRLKMTDQNIVFKNTKTGKVEQINASDMEMVNFQKFVGSWGLRIFLKNGTLHRFGGFKEGEQEKVAKFFSANYDKEMLEKELSLKGWNWGTAKFNGSILNFNVGHNTAFEIPLHYVSQCNTGKNEVTLEFHQNDDTAVSLMEMRFHITGSDEGADLDPVDAFRRNVVDKASVISVSGDAIAIFRELQCLTPRGRYDIKMFSSFFQLHGKTFDYKIPMSTVLRLFLLPHRDNRQMFFVVSLDPPIKQGQTRYHYLVLLFSKEEETTVELPYSEEELKEKYEDKIPKEVSGPTYEVVARIMKVIIGRRVTGPGPFMGHSGTPTVGCSYKAAAGYLYPLDKGFVFVHKPPIHIRFDEIASVNFARGGGTTRSFDFEVELKSGTIHTFSSIEKDEYGKLFDFITSKKLHVKNTGKNDKAQYKDDFGDSDAENEPDAYLERVKAEARERNSDGSVRSGHDSDESTDEDFKPEDKESDVAEEYDTDHTDSSSEEGSEGGGGAGGSGGENKEKKEKKKKEKKPKSAKTVSEKPRRRKDKSKKKVKDSNAPKRPATAFMIWLNETRKSIVEENPGLKVTEVAKRGGELWKEMKDKSKWEEKAAKAKEDYAKAMVEYKASGGGSAPVSAGSGEPAAKKKKTVDKKVSPHKSGSGSNYKSKEFLSDDDSSSDDGKKSKDKKRPTTPAKNKETKSKSASSGESEKEEDEEEEGSGSHAGSEESGSGSGSD